MPPRLTDDEWEWIVSCLRSDGREESQRIADKIKEQQDESPDDGWGDWPEDDE
jgi:hypothetical protein